MSLLVMDKWSACGSNEARSGVFPMFTCILNSSAHIPYVIITLCCSKTWSSIISPQLLEYWLNFTVKLAGTDAAIFQLHNATTAIRHQQFRVILLARFFFWKCLLRLAQTHTKKGSVNWVPNYIRITYLHGLLKKRGHSCYVSCNR